MRKSMRIHRNLVIAISLFVLINGEVHADSALLSNSPGGRATAMARAYTAVANDALATDYNPAGLSQIRYGAFYRENQLSDYGNFGVSYENKAIAINTQKWGTIGVSKREMTGQGTLKYNERAFSISYGIEVGNFSSFGNLSLGVTWKRLKTDPISQFGKINAFDSGILTRNIFPHTTYTKDLVPLPNWLANVRSRRLVKIVDIVYLKDGQVVRGNIFEERPGESITVEDEGGNTTTFSMDKVVKLARNQKVDIEVKNRLNTAKYITHRTSRGFSIGIGLFNVGEDDHHSLLSRSIRVGLSYSPIDTDFIGALVAFDTYHYEDHQFLGAGIEATMCHLLSFQYGVFYKTHYGEPEVNTWGIGIGPETFRFNYSDQNDLSFWSLSAVF